MLLHIKYSFAQTEETVCKTRAARNSSEKKSNHGIITQHMSWAEQKRPRTGFCSSLHRGESMKEEGNILAWCHCVHFFRSTWRLSFSLSEAFLRVSMVQMANSLWKRIWHKHCPAYRIFHLMHIKDPKSPLLCYELHLKLIKLTIKLKLN